ncbi:MAG TPA: lamin tail domain-containing protein, partial [Candidatus Poseidoniaceae archaeon]|nr:lamin tail domain-containing protein [Candidatus Poseidoniaceae archaeon]
MNKFLRIIIPLTICLLMFGSSFSTQILQVPDEKDALQVDARSTACTSDVCLSELLVNAQGGSETGAVSSANWAGAEWVELYNSGPNTVDLTDWKLRDNMNRDMILDTSRIVFPQGASDMNILSGEYMIVARNGDGGSCGFCMTNDGSTNTRSASLIDQNGISVHEATWSYYVSEGVTLIENPADS